MRRILVVDDEAVVRRSVCRIFGGDEFTVETSASGAAALERLQQRPFDLVITDLKMPGMDGIEVLKAIRVLQPDTPVVLITGYATVDTAVEAMKAGAVEYIAKPFTPAALLEKAREILGNTPPRTKGGEPVRNRLDDLVGASDPMQRVYQRILRVAPTDSTVLITGESGTGKELVARAIHRNSPRAGRPFVAVDCTALVETLLESELFGHVKGSFTGATHSKAGLFQVADGGTLFLDEVANISPAIQAKLLRVVQERMILPVGGEQPVPVDIRLVAATNRNLKAMVEAGTFREDLFFRLNIIPIELPPLRERAGDIAVLANHFLSKYADETGRSVRGFSPDAIERLESHGFPGNVRELENAVERAVVLCEQDWIRAKDLELDDGKGGGRVAATPRTPRTMEELKELKKEVKRQAVLPLEKAFVLDALRRNGWNITRAARETGMLRQNFQALVRKLDIRPPRGGGHQEVQAP